MQVAIDELYTMTEDLKKGKLTLVGTTTSFNISDIVGAENVGKYSADDFICVPNITSALEEKHHSNAMNASNVYVSVEKPAEFKVNYDSTTGDVSITNSTLTVNVKYYAHTTYVSTAKHVWNISPKVYLSL